MIPPQVNKTELENQDETAKKPDSTRKIVFFSLILLVHIIVLAGFIVGFRHFSSLPKDLGQVTVAAGTLFVAGFFSILLNVKSRKKYGITVEGGFIGMLPRDGIPLAMMLFFTISEGARGTAGYILVFFLWTLPLNVWLSLPGKEYDSLEQKNKTE